MIKIIEGNILQAKENIICHQVNCQSKMGSGLAAQIRRKYPIVYEKYMDLCNSFEDKRKLLGKTQVIEVSEDKCVANLFGQFTYGRTGIHTDYEALTESLALLKNMAEKYNKTVALPYGLGCGLGGGSWDAVYTIIKTVFDDYDVTIYKFV